MKMSKLVTKKNRRLKKYKERCIIYQKTIDAMQQNRVDAGVNDENDPAAMDEVRSQMIISTTDVFGMPICRSSSSINSMNPFNITNAQHDLFGESSTSTISVNPYAQPELSFGGSAVFHNKIPTTNNAEFAQSAQQFDFGALNQSMPYNLQKLYFSITYYLLTAFETLQV